MKFMVVPVMMHYMVKNTVIFYLAKMVMIHFRVDLLRTFCLEV